ncbi:hypothetical protein GS19_15820 [Acinetobacter idrijaensis]|nr:hypothetical protein GS19_15820 [Acinetobacter idrijaensis]
MDINKEREAFEAVTNTYHCIYNADLNYYFSGSKFVGDKAEIEVNAGWKAWQAKSQAVPEGFVLVKMDDLELLRDSALEIKYASLNNDSDRIFSDIEDIQLSIERLIEAQEPAND